MTRDVLVSLKGLQIYLGEDEQSNIEKIVDGRYYYKNGKHYVFYEEILTDTGEKIKSQLMFHRETFSLIRKGAFSMHMVFQKGQKNFTSYKTPFGDILLGIYTTTLDFQDDGKCMKIDTLYDLEINYTNIAQCNLAVQITAKDGK
jgi:uncharacterized beta-barrel protein YwiB (DUF1934 family)